MSGFRQRVDKKWVIMVHKTHALCDAASRRARGLVARPRRFFCKHMKICSYCRVCNSSHFLETGHDNGIVIAELVSQLRRSGNTQDPDRPQYFLALICKRLIGGWFWSLLSIHRYLFQTGSSIMPALQRYMDQRIKRCLANPAILVLALVYLSSAKRSKAVLPDWATKAL